MKNLPKSFKLFNSTIKVVVDNRKLAEDGCLGLSEYHKLELTIATKYKTRKLREDVIIDSFYHEKVHIILDSMGENKLSNNEKFVEVFARLLRQSDETAQY